MKEKTKKNKKKQRVCLGGEAPLSSSSECPRVERGGEPCDAVKSLSPAHPVGTPLDKVLVGVVRLQSLIGDCYDILTAPETTIMAGGRFKLSSFDQSVAFERRLVSK